MKTRRNDPCFCGSGRKYKNCCLRSGDSIIDGAKPFTIPLAVQSHPPDEIKFQRSCDGCSECCGPALIINDPDLISPSGQSCPHRMPSGCGNYENRPAICRGYICNYLVEPGLLEEDRPDRLGAIVRMALNRQLPEPLDRTTYVNESQPGGILRLLRNPRWKKAVTDDLLAAFPIYFTFIGDETGRETLLVRFFEGRLGCELTSCRDDGSPLMIDLTPTYDTPLQVALAIPQQGFAFEARALISHLLGRHQVVLGPSEQSDQPTPLRFLFTHRQAMVLKGLMRLIDNAQHAVAGRGAVSTSIGGS